MKINNISVVIITFNSAETILKTLNSLNSFQEIIIYDSYSTDKTVEIAKRFSNVKIFTDNFIGFGQTKNKAITFASNNWILSIDSDEVLNEDLIQEIRNIDLLKKDFAYKIKRDNFVLGKKINYSGMGNDWLIRIFNREKYQFIDLNVHEFVNVRNKSNIYKLKNSFSHIAVTDVSQFLFKIARYSELGSEKKKKYRIFTVFLKSSFAFFRTYFLKLGFLDGWRGLLISVSNANGRFYKYIRLI